MIPIETYDKKNKWDTVKKETVLQFDVGYITHPSLKKNRTHREHVIEMFQSAFKVVTLKFIKIRSFKKLYLFFH